MSTMLGGCVLDSIFVLTEACLLWSVWSWIVVIVLYFIQYVMELLQYYQGGQ